MKKVYFGQNPQDAHLMKGLLEEAGFSVFIDNAELWGVRGEVPMTLDTLPGVSVINDEDAERALQFVEKICRERKEAGGVVPDPWTCPECNESVEGQFAQCWKCQAARPAP